MLVTAPSGFVAVAILIGATGSVAAGPGGGVQMVGDSRAVENPTPTSTSVPSSGGLDVSYLDPPALVEPHVFATVNLVGDGTPSTAVFEDGAVIAAGGSSLTVIGWNGDRRDVAVTEPPVHLLAAGPGAVAYGIVQGPEAMDMAVNAYALSGPSAGEVLARTPVDPNRFVELPAAPVGHGVDGLIHRLRAPGEPITGYVDRDGDPLTWPDAPPLVTIDDTETVRVAEGPSWSLQIERDPTSPVPYEGWSAPAPSREGGAVYWTALGPPLDPASDFPDPTMAVVAVLHPDGTADWHQLPVGWGVAASDITGTILAKVDNGQLQLARLCER